MKKIVKISLAILALISFVGCVSQPASVPSYAPSGGYVMPTK